MRPLLALFIAIASEPAGEPPLARELGPGQLQRSSLNRNDVNEPALLLVGRDLPQFEQTGLAPLVFAIPDCFALAAAHWQ